MSDVRNFYADKTIFITGVTGFLGQTLLWKLLYTCPELRCIYVLIREKKGQLAHERLKKILDDPIFNPVKELHSDFETKIKTIEGDSFEYEMGISSSDREIIEKKVEIIFHAAATVKFNAPLKESSNINIRSLDFLLDTARKMKHLKAFMFVSTTYSPMVKTKLIEEKFYDVPFKAQDFLLMIEHLDKTVLNDITPRLLNSYPNSYIFTKTIAEDLCREKGSGLPLCIFRPAQIISCFKEPAPGWINNTYGSLGVLFGYAMGIIKVANVNPNNVANIIPGDYTTNALLLSTYYTSKSWEKHVVEGSEFDIPIINYSNCTTKFAITWGKYINVVERRLKNYPFYNMVTLPSLRLISNTILTRFLTIILHRIPAAIFDTVLVICRKKPRFIKLYKNIQEFLDLLAPFTLQTWTVTINNINKIWAGLSEVDKELFYCDLNDLNCEQYFDVFIRGMRLYLGKEKEDTVQKAKKKWQKFLILYFVLTAVVIMIFLYLLMGYSNSLYTTCFN